MPAAKVQKRAFLSGRRAGDAVYDLAEGGQEGPDHLVQAPDKGQR
jgi:hypothetical protein